MRLEVLLHVIARVLEAYMQESNPTPQPAAGASSGYDLVSHVGRVPHGTPLRAKYKGREYHAQVENGRVLLNGRRFDSLSSAAVGVIRSTGSNRPTENGWRVWEAKHPVSDEWVTVGDLYLNGARFPTDRGHPVSA